MAKFSISKYYSEKLAKEKNIIFPSSIFSTKTLKKIDQYYNQRSAANFANLFTRTDLLSKSAKLNEITQILSRKRKIRKEDKQFIAKIIKDLKVKKIDYILIDFFGVFVQIESIIIALQKENLSKVLKTALQLWIFLNLVEATSSMLATIFYFIAKEKNSVEYISLCEEKEKNGKHIEFGKLKNHAIKYGYISDNSSSIFELNEIRKQIAHGTIFYDAKKRNFAMRGSPSISSKSLRSKYSRLNKFYQELLFNLNDNTSNINSRIQEDFNKMARNFKKIERSNQRSIFQKMNLPKN